MTRNGKVSMVAGMTLWLAMQPLQAVEKDPYRAGFEAWASQLDQYGDKGMASAARSYLEDIHKAEREAGYLGQRVPLPEPVKVVDGVYTIVGSMIWHNPANYGFNNNLSFAIFENGVLVFNAGPNYAVAASAHDIIRRYTKKPVRWVVMENNQGHAMLGAGYWLRQGAQLYSAETAARQFDQAFEAIKREWSTRVGEEITLPSENVADKFITFNGEMTIDVGGGEKVELWEVGGHTPSATAAWVPSRKVFFAGDLLFNERMPVAFRYTNTGDWMEAIREVARRLPPDAIVVPGHGTPTDLQTALKQTLGYWEFLHHAVQQVIDRGGSLEEALQIDQSQYKNRPVYEQTYRRNAEHVYKELGGM